MVRAAMLGAVAILALLARPEGDGVTGAGTLRPVAVMADSAQVSYAAGSIAAGWMAVLDPGVFSPDDPGPGLR